MRWKETHKEGGKKRQYSKIEFKDKVTHHNSESGEERRMTKMMNKEMGQP